MQHPRLVKWLWIVAMFPFALLFFLLALTAIGLFGKLPSFEELENPKSNIATEIYSEDGKVLGSFFVQNRSYVEYAELFPEDSTQLLNLDGEDVPAVVAALISTEDERFKSHSGIDIKALIRVGVKTIALGNSGQGGGSTITQQVAKNLFPRDTTSRSPIMRKASLVISKLKEWITAVKLEYNYTKEEIVEILEEYENIIEMTELGPGKHIFSHIEWHMQGYKIVLKNKIKTQEYVWVNSEECRENYAIPTAFSQYTKRIFQVS